MKGLSPKPSIFWCELLVLRSLTWKLNMFFCGEKGDEPNLEISSWPQFCFFKLLHFASVASKLDFSMKISVEQWKKGPGTLFRLYVGMTYYPVSMVIIMRKNKDPYKPANIVESKIFFVFFSPVAQLMYPLSKFLPFVAGVLSTGAACHFWRSLVQLLLDGYLTSTWKT